MVLRNLLLQILVIMPIVAFGQLEEGPIEPSYHSKKVVSVKLSDFPKAELHGLAYEILNYDFQLNGDQILETINIEDKFINRKLEDNTEIFIPENNVTVIIYSELLFLENYRTLTNQSPFYNNDYEQ